MNVKKLLICLIAILLVQFTEVKAENLTYSIYIWVGKSSLLDNYSLSFSSVAGFYDYCRDNGIYNIEADCRYDIGVHEPLDSFIAF